MGLRDFLGGVVGKRNPAPETRALPSPKNAPSSRGPEARTDPDRPIESEVDDKFGRLPLARVIARYLAATPRGASVVFALTGPWGAGKTSVLNLIERELDPKAVAVVRFNPWLFAGTEQITSQFLRELAAQLGEKDRDLKTIGEKIEAYGSLLELGAAVPVIGGIAKGVQAAGKITAAHRRESVTDARGRVEALLRSAGRRVAVFVDDIDRLDADEVRQVLKLVRLVADFPNVSYLLAFDRVRVEAAVGASDVSGRDYIAKIVQSSFDLPPIDREAIRKVLTTELDRVLDGRMHGPFHESAWPDILYSVVGRLVVTPRDVRRYVNAVAPTVDVLGCEVALEDVLALEAIRTFLPDVYDSLGASADHLTLGEMALRGRENLGQAVIDSLIAAGGMHSDVVRELCRNVFPHSRFAIDRHSYGSDWHRRWRRDRRVACREVLEVYLARGIPAGAVPASIIRSITDNFGDAAHVDEGLGTLDEAQLEAAFGLLLDFHEDLATKIFEHGLAAVLRHADRLRSGRSGMFDFGADMSVRRLVLWTIRAADTAGRERAVRALMKTVESFTWRQVVLDVLSEKESREGILHRTTIEELERDLRAAILSASTSTLAREREPAIVLEYATYNETEKRHDSAAADRLRDPRLMRAVLEGSLGQENSQALGSVAVSTKYKLHLRALVSMCGGEAQLREHVEAALDVGPAPEGEERLRIALDLARDFRDGRTPLPPSDEDPEEVRADDQDGVLRRRASAGTDPDSERAAAQAPGNGADDSGAVHPNGDRADDVRGTSEPETNPAS